MSSTTDTRSNRRTWSPAYQTAPPPACQTLRNLNNAVEWGKMCVFGKEDGDPIPFSINTACMPWVTPNVYPSTGAFYSPATACPSSWSAVSTATTGDQWVSGETGLSCCPPGFEGDGRGGCRVGTTGSFPILECGEADAEENENKVYTAGQWPASATASITPLQLRYQASDIGSASASGNSPANTGSGPSNGSGSRGNGGGLSTGAKAAIGTVIPLVFIIGALAFALLYRRRKQKKAAMALAARNMAEEKDTRPSGSIVAAHASSPDSKHAPVPGKLSETPEWNAELDATDAERQGYAAYHYAEATELDGTGRVARKPVAPVEIDGAEVRAEVGDAYLPYRPGGVEGGGGSVELR
ncbi:hypothetical protein HBH98_183900 [Parastagonospora nodorum]|nr:hypothetical protein HBI01_025870 [Parastagonospora nodorum]KAH4315216.1 hypothetical protein HBI02_054390 [Parastagonospora nodorum]KAH4338319.1 hypothetical protein HBI00_002760 [Parastagonospora nodorum]KAH4340852.1 hypothetical protein HBH98_183900 [Parastagonospora nodorum]KAH4386610.1 hypothetical protein HBH94_042880 [Parastagonospora nodorum]